MGWSRDEVLRWVSALEARRTVATHFEVLEIDAEASPDALRRAYQLIASGAHPDVHRLTLDAADHERLVRAYSMVTLAYATLRDPAERARYRAQLPATIPPAPPAVVVSRTSTGNTGAHRARGVTAPGGGHLAFRSGRITGLPSSGRTGAPSSSPDQARRPTAAPPIAAPAPPAAAPAPGPPPVTPSPAPRPTANAARAQIYFRKAEQAWRTGDLAAARFNLRLAVAADPTSAQLQAALAQVEAELANR